MKKLFSPGDLVVLDEHINIYGDREEYSRFGDRLYNGLLNPSIILIISFNKDNYGTCYEALTYRGIQYIYASHLFSNIWMIFNDIQNWHIGFCKCTLAKRQQTRTLF